jgi:hypothetical protein
MVESGQWGSNAVIFFGVVTFGTIVVTRVQKLDVSLAFLLTFIGLLYWRQVYVLGWPMDHFIHSVSTGSFALHFFYDQRSKNIAQSSSCKNYLGCTYCSSFILSAAFKWKYNTIIWVLVAAAPLVPLLDKIF